MPKLPQNIEKLFDKEFPLIRETGIEEAEGVFFNKDDSDRVKSFIATILNEERERIIARFKDEWLGDDYHGEAIEEIIREMNIINIIKEDDTI